jgi:hypothetical protein
MFDLCQYKDIFGAPNTGLHTYRIFDIAVIDLLSTIVVAYIIYRVLSYNFTCVLLFLLLLGIVMHRLFCVRTTVDKLFFSK